jgi:phosphoserine phosphatase
MMEYKSRLIICDLDGTLYNSEKRAHLAQQGLWDEFHAASSEDMPNEDVLAAIYCFDSVENTIIAITGRNEKFRGITEEWFNKHLVPIDTLLMRPDGDFRSDKEVKIGLFEQWNSTLLDPFSKEDVLMALEDRDKMVDAWREYGVNCWQVRVGGY